MSRPEDCQPIGADEVAGLFAPLLPGAGEPVALAVSGGCDSTALMALFADWLGGEGADAGRHVVLTVDHRLRPESTAEAGAVAARAAALGFAHATLVWEGEKPRSGIQAAARAARYRLMLGYLAAHRITTLITAHTQDDQAETLLMRLARGSGLDGLAGVAPALDVVAPGGEARVRLLRPLLGVPRLRLKATLDARGLGWSEDPTNISLAFERPRLRAARAALDALGLTDAMLASSVRRLRRARAALEAIADAVGREETGIVRADRCGFFVIDRERLGRLPEELIVRLIGRCIAAAGGSGEPVPLAKLEAVVAGLVGLGHAGTGSWTLARAHISAGTGAIRIEREPGRRPLPTVTLAAGERACWDGRFAVAAGHELESSLHVRALGVAGLRELARLGHPVKATSALRLVPAFWQGKELVAVPTLDFWANAGFAALIAADFLGLRYNPLQPAIVCWEAFGGS